MTNAETEKLLDALGAVTAGQAILWRGGSLTGRDIDLVVSNRVVAEATSVLFAAGFIPDLKARGNVVWHHSSGTFPPLDVLYGSAWPPCYPSLSGVLARAAIGEAPIPVASPEDRLLIFAADAVAGRPLRKLVGKAGPLLELDQGVRARLGALAAAEDGVPLAALIQNLSDRSRAAADRYPWWRSVGVAVHSRLGRAACLRRFRLHPRRIVARLRTAPTALLVSASGMDGAGKSTVTDAVRQHLLARGVPVTKTWARLGADAVLLNRLAHPVKKVLRRNQSVADPIAVRTPDASEQRAPRPATGRRGLVAWAWIVVVAATHVRTMRASSRPRRDGVAVVCDRWAVDALVDLRLRYGRHRTAEWLVRHLLPHPDLALMLEVDPETAALRKPNDQALVTLHRMHDAYDELSTDMGLIRLDANLPAEDVAATSAQLVDVISRS